jgi:hypothetical protein
MTLLALDASDDKITVQPPPVLQRFPDEAIIRLIDRALKRFGSGTTPAADFCDLGQALHDLYETRGQRSRFRASSIVVLGIALGKGNG